MIKITRAVTQVEDFENGEFGLEVKIHANDREFLERMQAGFYNEIVDTQKGDTQRLLRTAEHNIEWAQAVSKIQQGTGCNFDEAQRLFLSADHDADAAIARFQDENKKEKTA